ncbi:hypothetical protein LTR81_026996 [Elasticomyces elasticus]
MLWVDMYGLTSLTWNLPALVANSPVDRVERSKAAVSSRILSYTDPPFPYQRCAKRQAQCHGHDCANTQIVRLGYTAFKLEETATGLTAELKLADQACNAYGTDVKDLTLSEHYLDKEKLAVRIYARHLAPNDSYILSPALTPQPGVEYGSSNATSDPKRLECRRCDVIAVCLEGGGNAGSVRRDEDLVVEGHCGVAVIQAIHVWEGDAGALEAQSQLVQDHRADSQSSCKITMLPRDAVLGGDDAAGERIADGQDGDGTIDCAGDRVERKRFVVDWVRRGFPNAWLRGYETEDQCQSTTTTVGGRHAELWIWLLDFVQWEVFHK